MYDFIHPHTHNRISRPGTRSISTQLYLLSLHLIATVADACATVARAGARTGIRRRRVTEHGRALVGGGTEAATLQRRWRVQRGTPRAVSRRQRLVHQEQGHGERKKG